MSWNGTWECTVYISMLDLLCNAALDDNELRYRVLSNDCIKWRSAFDGPKSLICMSYPIKHAKMS